MKGVDTMIILALAALVAAFVSMFAAILLGGSTPIICMACAIVIARAAAKADEVKDRKAAEKWQAVSYGEKVWG